MKAFIRFWKEQSLWAPILGWSLFGALSSSITIEKYEGFGSHLQLWSLLFWVAFFIGYHVLCWRMFESDPDLQNLFSEKRNES